MIWNVYIGSIFTVSSVLHALVEAKSYTLVDNIRKSIDSLCLNACITRPGEIRKEKKVRVRTKKTGRKIKAVSVTVSNIKLTKK